MIRRSNFCFLRTFLGKNISSRLNMGRSLIVYLGLKNMVLEAKSCSFKDPFIRISPTSKRLVFWLFLQYKGPITAEKSEHNISKAPYSLNMPPYSHLWRVPRQFESGLHSHPCRFSFACIVLSFICSRYWTLGVRVLVMCLKGLWHAICHLFKKLKRVFASIAFQK